MELELRLVSSLEKVFADRPLAAAPFAAASALKGEVFNFQLAVCNRTMTTVPGVPYRQVVAHISADCKLPCEVRAVRSVPVDVPCQRPGDDLLDNRPGLYPDLLTELPGGVFRFPGSQWRAFWFTVRIPENARAGRYPVKITLEEIGADGRPPATPCAVTSTFELRVVPAKLPAQQLLRYEWFHVDCLHSVYRVPCWSEEHWRIIENFAANAARHGINVLMTPLWSLPLDTAVGGERPTTQLLMISRRGGRYRFDFSRLDRYVELGLRCGMTRFAMSHFFTQWGAKATPKIVVDVDGVETKLFGWHVPADSPEYANFLRQLMPELLNFFRGKGLEKRIYFSVSDEPYEKDIDSYAKAAQLVEPLLGGCPAIDALSNYEIYRRGLVKHPIPSSNHIEDFVGRVPELNTYYCISQEAKVPNRFMAMPGSRTRIMGIMFYLYDIRLFLQWGFNFYFTQYSLGVVDPYRDTCAGNWTPAGDAFLVYPGPDGTPEDSLRNEVFFDGIQDLRALCALEKKIGRDAVIATIQSDVPYKITMERYPRTSEWLLSLRERVNALLA